MTFMGPLNFIDDDGNTLALVGWQQVYQPGTPEGGQQPRESGPAGFARL